MDLEEVGRKVGGPGQRSLTAPQKVKNPFRALKARSEVMPGERGGRCLNTTLGTLSHSGAGRSRWRPALKSGGPEGLPVSRLTTGRGQSPGVWWQCCGLVEGHGNFSPLKILSLSEWGDRGQGRVWNRGGSRRGTPSNLRGSDVFGFHPPAPPSAYLSCLTRPSVVSQRKQQWGEGASVSFTVPLQTAHTFHRNSKPCALAERLHPPLNEFSCPAPLALRLPCPASRAADPKSAWLSVAQSHQQGARSAGQPQPGARLPAPDAAYLPAWPRRNPGVPRRKAALRGRRGPRSPKELIPVAGGGGAEREGAGGRRKGRRFPLRSRRELVRGRPEKGERRTTPARGCPAREGSRDREAGRGGRGRRQGPRVAAARRGPAPGGQAAGERAQQPAPDCARRALPGGEKSWDELSGAGRARAAGNASGRERRERAWRVGGDGAGAGGRGSPPQARLGGAGGAAGRAPGAGRSGRGGRRRRGGTWEGSPELQAQARVLGDVTALESENAELPELHLQAREKCTLPAVVALGEGFQGGGLSREDEVKLPWSKRRGEWGKTKGPQQPHLAPLPGGAQAGGGSGAGKSHQELRNLQRQGRGGAWPTRPTAPHLVRGTAPSRMSHAVTAQENRPGERRGGFPSRQSFKLSV